MDIKNNSVRCPLTQLTDDEVQFQQKVRQFAQREVQPLATQMDKKGVASNAVLAGLFREKLMSILIPNEYGGLAGDFFKVVLAIEEIARVEPALAIYVHVQNSLVINALSLAATIDQKRKYFPALASASIASFAVSEREAGSDAFSMETRATLSGSDYILNGSKYWISSAAEAEQFLIFAKTASASEPDNVTAFMVTRDTPGLHVGPNCEKLGVRASSTCEVRLENVRVPMENVIGQVGKGNQIAVETLNEGRIGVAAQMLGLAQGAYQVALRYAQQRKQFGQAIANFQAVHFLLAEMATDIEAARLMVYNAARIVDGSPSPVEKFQSAAMAKYMVSKVAEKIASESVEILGGNGYTKEFPVEKFYRDAKVGKIYEGTTNMQLRTIATTLVKKQQSNSETKKATAHAVV